MATRLGIDDELSAEILEQYGRFCSIPQAAEITATSPRTVQRLIDSGELPCFRIGRTRALRLRTADVTALIQRVA